jgi:cytochrome c
MSHRSLILTGLALIACASGPLAAQNPQPAQPPPSASAPGGGSDKAAFNNHCRTCHSAKEGDNRLGPSLAGIIGAKAGTRPGYANYSGAMKGAGITWDEATLDRFIANPDEVVPNNNMKPFKGVPDAAVRKRIIAAMKSDSGQG